MQQTLSNKVHSCLNMLLSNFLQRLLLPLPL